MLTRILIALVLLTGAASAKPLVIAHRGASGYLPEHTLEAYKLAIEMGADFIEPDLVSTKDGVLIARHENEISGTTDVAAKFPGRKTTKTIDGEKVEGWFSEDFTLAEIKTLRANERLAARDQSSNGKFAVPTFAEVVALATAEAARRGRPVGLYPETKHPSYFKGIGLALERPLLKALNSFTGPVYIQSFEVSNLKALKAETALPLIQLLGAPDEKPADQAALTYGRMMTDAGLKDIAGYASGIGPVKLVIIPVDKEGYAQAPTDLVTRAHGAGLAVHPYTFRSDQAFLPRTYAGDPVKEYCAFYALGVDGLFTDFPDTALTARDKSCEPPPAREQ